MLRSYLSVTPTISQSIMHLQLLQTWERKSWRGNLNPMDKIAIIMEQQSADQPWHRCGPHIGHKIFDHESKLFWKSSRLSSWVALTEHSVLWERKVAQTRIWAGLSFLNEFCADRLFFIKPEPSIATSSKWTRSRLQLTTSVRKYVMPPTTDHNIPEMFHRADTSKYQTSWWNKTCLTFIFITGHLMSLIDY